MSSPEASNSSSEDEFDLNAPSMSAPRSASATDSEAAKKKAAEVSKLFSDEEDEDDDAGNSTEEKPAAKPKAAKSSGGSSDEDRDKDKEMEDLFGSDYDSEEEEFKASGIKESPVREENRVAQDLYTEDYQSNVGGQGGSHSHEIWLPKTPKAPKSASYFIGKMPNILRLVPEAYTKQAIEEEMLNPSDEMLYRNYVRWRYQRDDQGRVKLDPKTKTPLRESNTKVVQWEDGTFTMFVGKEALNLSRQKIPNSFLFATEVLSEKPELDGDEPDVLGADTVLECHGRLKEKLTIRPTTTSSKSHKSLTMSMRAKHNKGVQKIKQYISELDGEREQEQRAKINDDRLRLQNRKKSRQTHEFDRERGSRMNASFLEEGYDGVEYDDGEDVAAIKEQFGGKSRAKSGASGAGRRPAPPVRRSSTASSFRGDGFDEYSRSRAREEERSESEHEQAEEEDDDEDDEEDIVRSVKKRRTVDEEDSD